MKKIIPLLVSTLMLIRRRKLNTELSSLRSKN